MDASTFELIKTVMGEHFAKDFFIWTTSLSVASYIHSGRVKKEMKNIVEALNGFATALREDINKQSVRIDRIESELTKLKKP